MKAIRLRSLVFAMTGVLLAAAPGIADPITYMQGSVPSFSLVSGTENGVQTVKITFGQSGQLSGDGVASPFTMTLPTITLTADNFAASAGGSPPFGFQPVADGAALASRADGSAAFNLVFDSPVIAADGIILTLIGRPDLLSNTTTDDLTLFDPTWDADRDFGITFISLSPFGDFADIFANGGFLEGFAAFSFLATGGTAPPPAVVPEPATLAIWGMAVSLIAWRNRKRILNQA